MSERLYDTFGAERASHDLARTKDRIDDFFVQTTASRFFLGVDPVPPFIVGAKGVGKSLLLFRHLLNCRGLSGVMVLPRAPEYAFSPSEQFATAVRESSFWPVMADESGNFETWSTMWQSALLRTIFSGWLAHDEKAERTANADRLRELSRNSTDTDPFDVVLEHLEELEAPGRITRGRFQPIEQRPLLQFLRQHADEYPPPYLFIDNSDECFTDNPEFWIRSCVGLFRAVQVLRERSGHRIHVFITLRPEVVLRLQRNEQFPQWQSDIFRVQWEDEELLKLFRVRARHLKPELLQSPALVSRDPMAALLGGDLLESGSGAVVQNEAVGVKERVASYILRHTLRRPRDLIIVGGQILLRTRQRAEQGDSHADIVRQAVASAAEIIGAGYLAEVRQSWPWGTTGETSIDAFIHSLPRNVLTRKDAEMLQRRFANRVGRDVAEVHPMTKLVSLGLVGYPVPSPSTGMDRLQNFVMAGETSTANVPLTAEWYLVHPVLYGHPFHIVPFRGLVVGPGLPFRPGAITELAIVNSFNGDGYSDVGVKPSTTRKRRRKSRRVARKAIKESQTTVVFRWLHLSDLHFGAGSESHRFDQQAVARAIRQDVERNCPKPIDYVLVTGDISYSAKAEQYASAGRWLSEVASALGCERDRVVLVPGNHDVNRSVASVLGTRHAHRAIRALPQDIDTAIGDLDTRAKLLEKLAEYISFAEDFGAKGHDRGGALDWARSISPVAGVRGPIRLVGLSTVWVSDEFDGRSEGRRAAREFEPNMVLGKGPMQSLLHGDGGDQELVMVLSHHPPEWLHPVSRKALQQALAPVSSIHLCGHVHKSAARVERLFGGARGAIRIIAGAAHMEEGDDEGSHSYSWGALRWNAERLRWEVGWAPRLYDHASYEMCPMPHPGLDSNHEVWEAIDLAWDPPGQAL